MRRKRQAHFRDTDKRLDEFDLGFNPRIQKRSSLIRQRAGSFWKAPSRAEAEQRAADFVSKYEAEYPKVADIVRDDLEATLAFNDLDAAVWASLRSTNIQERVHRELQRKFGEVGALWEKQRSQEPQCS